MGARWTGVTWLVLACAAAACGPAAATPPAPTPPPLPLGLAADHPLVVAEQLGGPTFVMDTFDPRSVSLHADGTLVAPGHGSTLLSAVATTLDRPALDEAWALVHQGGLAVDRGLDLPGLYDAGTIEIRVDDGSTVTRLAVYALGAEPVEGEATFAPDEAALRRAASSTLAALRERAGSDPWTPPALLLWWGASEEAPSGAGPAHLVAWPGPVDLATAGAPVDNPLFARCVRLDGEDAAAVAAFAATAPPDVIVEQAGVRYGLGVRPIYPDELDSVACP